ncbi:MAG TPA: DUF2121 domain-containing protein [Methanothrix sp.]
MSLIIALAGSREAVIGGDRRCITFLGSCSELEDELYSGRIRNDRELLAKAKALGATLQVSDGKDKVWRRGDLLVGEVTEISSQQERRRRIYLTPGASLEVDITGNEARIRAHGGIGCVVFGNRFTQELAGSSVASNGGRVNESLIRSIFALAGERTASVSREHVILKSDIRPFDPGAALQKALAEDCTTRGWRLCDPQ